MNPVGLWFIVVIFVPDVVQNHKWNIWRVNMSELKGSVLTDYKK